MMVWEGAVSVVRGCCVAEPCVCFCTSGVHMCDTKRASCAAVAKNTASTACSGGVVLVGLLVRLQHDGGVLQAIYQGRREDAGTVSAAAEGCCE